MSEFLRERIARRLDTLPDERLYQVLDYIEFLESKYAQRQAPPSNVFQRFAEGVEDSLRAGRVSVATIGETMNLLNKAMGVLSGVAAAGRSVASDVVEVAKQASRPPAPGRDESRPVTPAAEEPNGGTTS